jgi:hypothetical protein
VPVRPSDRGSCGASSVVRCRLAAAHFERPVSDETRHAGGAGGPDLSESVRNRRLRFAIVPQIFDLSSPSPNILEIFLTFFPKHRAVHYTPHASSRTLRITHYALRITHYTASRWAGPVTAWVGGVVFQVKQVGSVGPPAASGPGPISERRADVKGPRVR